MGDHIFFHIDVNSAFLSWTALSLLQEGSGTDLRLIPSIVGGDMAKRHGVVLAKSLPAKAYGITTGEPVVNALRKCPVLVTVPPDHAMYHRRSRELMQLLSDICPDIEQVSIDECYMDYTPISKKYSSPREAARQIKDKVRDTLGFTVNVGISDRKVLAKMASDFRKPDLVHTLFVREIPEKLWPLPVSSLFLCGQSSVETLRKLGILTIGDLAHTQTDILEAHLKSHGLTLWQYANGIDDSDLTPKPVKVRGVGNSTTLPGRMPCPCFSPWPSPWPEDSGPPGNWQEWSARRSNTLPSGPYPTKCSCPPPPLLPRPSTRPPANCLRNSGTESPYVCWGCAPPNWRRKQSRCS